MQRRMSELNPSDLSKVIKQYLDKREENEENKDRLSTYKKYREVSVPEEFNAYRDRKIAAVIKKEKNDKANYDRLNFYYEDPLGARSYGTVSPSSDALQLQELTKQSSNAVSEYTPKITTTSLGGKKSRKRRSF